MGADRLRAFLRVLTRRRSDLDPAVSEEAPADLGAHLVNALETLDELVELLFSLLNPEGGRGPAGVRGSGGHDFRRPLPGALRRSSAVPAH